jgi:hypothetical protein
MKEVCRHCNRCNPVICLARVLKELGMKKATKASIDEYVSPYSVYDLNERNFVHVAKYYCAITRGMHVFEVVPPYSNIEALVKFYKSSTRRDRKVNAVMADLRDVVFEFMHFMNAMSGDQLRAYSCWDMSTAHRHLQYVYHDYDAWVSSLPKPAPCRRALCSICFTEVGTRAAVSCDTCKQAVHTACLDGYKRHLRNDIVPCPTCRRMMS